MFYVSVTTFRCLDHVPWGEGGVKVPKNKWSFFQIFLSVCLVHEEIKAHCFGASAFALREFLKVWLHKEFIS